MYCKLNNSLYTKKNLNKKIKRLDNREAKNSKN